MTAGPDRGIDIRPCRHGDETAVNEGFNTVFSQGRSLEEWRWKFAEHPEGRWVMVACEPGGQVLAHYAAVAVRFQVGSREVRAGQAVDSYSRPEARRGLAAARVYLAVTERFFAEFGGPDRLAFLFGFPGLRHFRLGVARLKYDAMPPRPVTEMRRQRRPRGRWRTGHRVRTGWDWEAVDALWQQARYRYEFAAIRNSSWVRRRFTGRPGVEYRLHVAWRDTWPAAWAVTRRLDRKTMLADLCWDGNDAGALAALDRALLREARRREEEVYGWLDGDPMTAAVLRDLGWLARPQPDQLRLVARSFDPELPIEKWGEHMYTTMGDSDLV